MVSSSSTFKTYSFQESIIFFYDKIYYLKHFSLEGKFLYKLLCPPPYFDILCYALHGTIVALGFKRYNIWELYQYIIRTIVALNVKRYNI